MKSISARLFLLAFTIASAYFTACTGAPTDLDAFPNPTAECTESAECPSSKPICDELAGCVECQYDDQCQDGERCHQRACTAAPACSATEYCPTERPVCNPVRGYCIECSQNADCGDSARCIDQECEPATACVNSRDCEADQVCHPTHGFCVECAGEGDCPEEHACVEEVCKPKCASDKDCVADGLLCNTMVEHCVECLRDVDCPDSYFCEAGECKPDACQPGTGYCAANAEVIYACNPNGGGQTVVDCPFSTTCAEDDAGPICQPWICTPQSRSCATSTEVSVCSDDGLSTTSVDCAEAGGACVDGACAVLVCEPNDFVCVDGASMRCDYNGTSLSLYSTCPVTTFCSEETGLCDTDVCVAGQPTCLGSVATACKGDGSGYEKGEDCAASDEICWEAECLPTICTDGAEHCHDTDAYDCTDGGTARTLKDICSSVEYCAVSNGFAVCLPMSCSPGQEVCQGTLAGTCNATGNGLEGGFVDCETSDQACYQGQCLDILCEGTAMCDENGDVRACAANGTALGSVIESCSDNEYCYEAIGYESTYCSPDACSEGQSMCLSTGSESGIGVCNADGSGFDLVDPCDTDEVCVGNTCLPRICDPYTYYCLNGNVYYCGSDGTTNALQDTCSAGEYCADGYGYCLTDVCTAGNPLCAGVNLSTCAADGSGPADAGTACPTGETCVTGACAPVICTPGSERCSDNLGQTCNASGTAWTTTLSCGTAQFCDSTVPNDTVCSYDICDAGQPACDGETMATCGPYGGDYTAQGTDCSLTGQLCNETACVDFEELTFAAGASASATSTARTYFNRFDVVNQRKLTEIEQYFAASGTSQYTFYVYRFEPELGYFEEIFNTLVTSTPGSGGDYVSSGPIAVTLEAGYLHAIGVRTSGSYTYYSASTVDTYESFGRFDGGSVTTSFPASLMSLGETTTVYRQRLTLEPVP